MIREPFDKRLAALIVKPLGALPITPNAITACGLVAGLTAAVLFAAGTRGTAGWAGGLFMLACFLDHVDGELARLTQRCTRFGHSFDRITSAIVLTAAFIGLGFGARFGALGNWAVVLGTAAGIAVASIFAVRNRVELNHGHDAIAQPATGGFEIEDGLYLIGPIAWAGWTTAFVAAAGVGAPLYLLFTLLHARHGRA